jgi:hypothetical protein
MSIAQQLAVAETEPDVLLWIGQSGRQYRLLPESFPGFQLRDGLVHVLVSGATALWAGSADDVVADPQSRSRFRKAMGGEVAVYRLEPTPDEKSRPTIAWDIVNGRAGEPLALVDFA